MWQWYVVNVTWCKIWTRFIFPLWINTFSHIYHIIPYHTHSHIIHLYCFDLKEQKLNLSPRSFLIVTRLNAGNNPTIIVKRNMQGEPRCNELHRSYYSVSAVLKRLGNGATKRKRRERVKSFESSCPRRN